MYISELELVKAKNGEPYAVMTREGDGLYEIDLTDKNIKGYSIVDSVLFYDDAYVDPEAYEIKMRRDLAAITRYVEELALVFASENSKILYELLVVETITIEAKEAYVLECADALKPIFEDFKIYSYPAAFAKVDAIARTWPLLTDERLNEYKLKAQTFMAGL